MTTNSFLDSERKSLEKLKKLQLPNYFKKVGYILFILSFIVLLTNQFIIEELIVTLIAKYGMLIGMLIYSVSKEKIEDELIVKLRSQSYTFAFIIGVIYTLIQPVVNYLFDFIIDDNKPNFENYGDFNILWFLLSIQLFYFEFQKRLFK